MIQSVIVAQVVSSHDSQASQQNSQFFANPQIGFAAIKNTATANTQLLDDGDFGLDAQTNDPDYGLKRIADDIQDTDFGLDAQTNDPDYGLKRISSDIQHSDWGVEIIDDEIELIDQTIEKQVTKQRVSISAMKSDNRFYIQTSEFGHPVDVDFDPVILLIEDDSLILPANKFSITNISTGLYLLDIKFKGDFDAFFLKATHTEIAIMHPSLGADINADHFGTALISPAIEKTEAQ